MINFIIRIPGLNNMAHSKFKNVQPQVVEKQSQLLKDKIQSLQ